MTIKPFDEDGYALLSKEWMRLGGTLLRIDKVIAGETFRQDFPFPGAFIENMRHVYAILKPLTVGDESWHFDAGRWGLLEKECQAALRTVEAYRAPGFQGNPMATFKDASMDFIEQIPDLIQTIQTKVLARLRADRARRQAPTATNSRQRMRS